MAVEVGFIRLNQRSDLGEILSAASSAPVLVERDGTVYRVSLEHDDLLTGYDPAAVRRVLYENASAMTPEEGAQRLADIFRAREEGSRPANRP